MKTYKDIYEFPLKNESSIYIRDNKGQVVAQFHQDDLNFRKKLLDVVNSVPNAIKSTRTFYHEDGYIKTDGVKVILIRGWGNLTGVGSHNLSAEEAANVQDTLAEFIVNKLNGKI